VPRRRPTCSPARGHGANSRLRVCSSTNTKRCRHPIVCWLHTPNLQKTFGRMDIGQRALCSADSREPGTQAISEQRDSKKTRVDSKKTRGKGIRWCVRVNQPITQSRSCRGAHHEARARAQQTVRWRQRTRQPKNGWVWVVRKRRQVENRDTGGGLALVGRAPQGNTGQKSTDRLHTRHASRKSEAVATLSRALNAGRRVVNQGNVMGVGMR
jgi:hypothetical protein